MNMNIKCTTDSAANLHDCENRSSRKSNESIRKPIKVKELFHRDLNKSILKLCSEADLRIKVLLSNKGSGVITSSSKLSSKESTSILGGGGTSTKFSSLSSLTKLSSLGTIPKTISTGASNNSQRKSHKKISQADLNSTCHFNTEIDNIDDPTIKQLTVLKIIKLRDIARRLEKRQNTLIRHQFESTGFERSYTDGLEEGLRYGYFNNPYEEPKTQTKKTGKTNASTCNKNNQEAVKNNEVELPENIENKRMRGGFQDPQQKEIRLKNTLDQKVSSPTNKTEIKIQTEPSGIIITNEYPTKCDENVNVQAFNQKYRISNTKLKYTNESFISDKDLNIDRGDHYLQYFEKMLSSLGEDFAKGFRAGFGDGFEAANIFVSNDTTFAEDEKDYIIQMRKCLKFSEINLENDIKKIDGRVDEMKNKLNIPTDEFEEISNLLLKGMIKKNPLKFSKNDYKHYIDASKRDRENIKVKSCYEDESDIAFMSYEEARYIPQHTKNRAKKYLTKHRINEFFQFLGSHLVATKPDDPITFLINLLDKCIEYRINEYIVQAPLLFTKKHVESVFFVLDPLSTGFIDLYQYNHGMEALGIGDLEDLTNFRPGEKIDRYIFVTNASRRLLCKFRGMIAFDTVTVIPSNVAYDAN